MKRLLLLALVLGFATPTLATERPSMEIGINTINALSKALGGYQRSEDASRVIEGLDRSGGPCRVIVSALHPSGTVFPVADLSIEKSSSASSAQARSNFRGGAHQITGEASSLRHVDVKASYVDIEVGSTVRSLKLDVTGGSASITIGGENGDEASCSVDIP